MKIRYEKHPRSGRVAGPSNSRLNVSSKQNEGEWAQTLFFYTAMRDILIVIAFVIYANFG